MQDLNTKTIGFIGLGHMGGPIGRRMLEAGYSLVVFDVNSHAMKPLIALGATQAESPKAVADLAQVIFLSLPTPDVVRSVSIGKQGVVHGDAAKVVVDLSTTGPDVVTEVARELHAKSISMLDCPVSGGASGARNGTLALIASGDPLIYEHLKPLLSCFGRLFHVGDEPGMAQTMKIINNLISVTSLAITSEVMVLGAKAGLDVDAMIDVLNASSGRTSASVDKVPNFVLPRSFDFGFPIGLSVKDVSLCLERARALGVPMHVGQAVVDFIVRARDTCGERADMTEMIRMVEMAAGVMVKGRAARNDA